MLSCNNCVVNTRFQRNVFGVHFSYVLSTVSLIVNWLLLPVLHLFFVLLFFGLVNTELKFKVA